MEVFFCDKCGARVTDADLHRGHGIKKADTVVCGTCIENGEGNELLMAVGAFPGAGSAAPAVAGAAALNEVRDRVSTNLAEQDEDDGPELIPQEVEPAAAEVEAVEPELPVEAEPEPEPISEPEAVLETVSDEPAPEVSAEPEAEDPFGEDDEEADDGADLIPKATDETATLHRSKSDDLANVATGFAALRSEDRTSSDIEELSEDIQEMKATEDDSEDDDILDEAVPQFDDDDDSDDLEEDLDEDLDEDIEDLGYSDDAEGLAQGAIDTMAIPMDKLKGIREAGSSAKKSNRSRGGAKGKGGRGAAGKSSKRASRAGGKSGTSNRLGKASGGSSKSTNASRTRSTSRSPAAKKKNPMGIMIGIISALSLGVIGLLIIVNVSGGDNNGPTNTFKRPPVHSARDSIEMTYEMVNNALRR